jgi:pimeloyl-ACP methyl ester carboxylesterase
MGFATKLAMRYVLNKSNRNPVPREFVDSVWEHFDHGTQRAILKLYRSAPPEVLARAGGRLGEIRAPALVVWGGGDPYLSSDFAHRYAGALGGETTVEVLDDAGHWPWLDESSLVERVAQFLAP